MNLRERAAEKRRVKLLDIDDRVADGSLKIREMTAAERSRFGIGDPDRPFRRFFFPGARPGTRRGEDEYQRAARAVRAAVGDRPAERRVFRVDCPVDGQACRLQVGEPAPAGQTIVTAIFELRERGELVVSTADDAIALRLEAAGADVLEFVV
jgi:hypothetical protein